MENSLLDIFDKIWPKTLYYSTGCLSNFGVTLKKSNFNWNQLKRSTEHKKEHKYMYIDNKTITCYNVHNNNVLVNSPILT